MMLACLATTRIYTFSNENQYVKMSIATNPSNETKNDELIEKIMKKIILEFNKCSSQNQLIY